jgi:hypothetical protein
MPGHPEEGEEVEQVAEEKEEHIPGRRWSTRPRRPRRRTPGHTTAPGLAKPSHGDHHSTPAQHHAPRGAPGGRSTASPKRGGGGRQKPGARESRWRANEDARVRSTRTTMSAVERRSRSAPSRRRRWPETARLKRRRRRRFRRRGSRKGD